MSDKEFDARAFVQNYYAEREGSHPSAIFAIHETDIEIAERAYAAGRADALKAEQDCGLPA